MDKEIIKKAIRENPGAVLLLDNDYWELRFTSPGDDSAYPDAYDKWDWEKQEKWTTSQRILEGDGPPQCDLLEALAEMAGVTCEDV